MGFLNRRKVYETTTPDAVIMDDPYDEHHYDPKSQGLVDTITGTTSVEQSREGEVLQMADQQHHANEAVRQLARVLGLAAKEVARVSPASSQVRMRTIALPAGQSYQIASKNEQRSRLLINVLATEDSYLVNDGIFDNPVTSPDTPNMTIKGDVRWTAYVRDDSAQAAVQRHIFDRRGNAATTLSYSLSTFDTAVFALGWPAGTSPPQVGPALLRTAYGLTPPGINRYVGWELVGVNPLSVAATLTPTGIISTDGYTWKVLSAVALVRADAFSFESNSVLRMGSDWLGRIYWTQMERINKRAFVFPGAAFATSDRLQVPDEVALQIAGDITVTVDMDAVSYTGAGVIGWITSRGGSFAVNGCTYIFFQNTDGTLGLTIDSPTGLQTFSSPSLAALPLGRRQFAVSLDVDDGAAGKVHQWLTSTDGGTTWSVLATTTVPGTTSIKTTAALQPSIGGRGSTLAFDGTIYGVTVRDGIGTPGTVGGTLVLSVNETDVHSLPAGSLAFTAGTGQAVTVFQDLGHQVIQSEPDEVIFRFDANEYPGGTFYFDPRGRLWNVTPANMVVASGVCLIGTDPNLTPDYPGNAYRIPVTSFSERQNGPIEVNTVGDVWAYSDVPVQVSLVEEWVS